MRRKTTRFDELTQAQRDEYLAYLRSLVEALELHDLVYDRQREAQPAPAQPAEPACADGAALAALVDYALVHDPRLLG